MKKISATSTETAKKGHYIVTEYVFPPIPERSMDWSAVLRDYDGAPDSTGPNSKIGRGPTETAAVADLLCQIESWQEDDAYQDHLFNIGRVGEPGKLDI